MPYATALAFLAKEQNDIEMVLLINLETSLRYG